MSNNTLHNSNKTGFKTPDGYFESLEDTIIAKVNDGTILNDIKDAGFKAPDTYFETFEDNVVAKISKEKDTKVVSLFSRRNLLIASSIAAAVMIMFGLFYKKPALGLESLDTELVETYLNEQDLNTYDLASLLTEDDLNDSNFGISGDSFTDESLENYLLNNANLEDLIEN